MIARADALAALEADEFDVVVVGGGITGAGCALDAATHLDPRIGDRLPSTKDHIERGTA